MRMANWFVEHSGQIEGPYSTETIQARLREGHLAQTDQIWGRVMEEWRSLSWWTTSLNDIMNKEKQITHPEIWHYAYNGETFGPLNWDELIHRLRMLTDSHLDRLREMMIWTQGMSEWASVVEFHDIMDGLGINKREFARAPVNGKAVIKSRGNTFIAPLRSISEGGFGTDVIPNLLAGETVTVELQSGAFSDVVRAQAQVRYVSGPTVGFKFSNISVESRGIIVQFVRKTAAGAGAFFKGAA